MSIKRFKVDYDHHSCRRSSQQFRQRTTTSHSQQLHLAIRLYAPFISLLVIFAAIVSGNSTLRILTLSLAPLVFPALFF